MPQRYDDDGNPIPEGKRYDDFGNEIHDQVDLKGRAITERPYNPVNFSDVYRPKPAELLPEDPLMAKLSMPLQDAPMSTPGIYSGRANPIAEYNRNAQNVVAAPPHRSRQQELTSMAIRSAPPMIGSYAGATAGSFIPVPGAGTMGGMALGGGAGGVIGAGLGQLYDWWTDPNFKGFNATEMGAQGLINAVPFGGKVAPLAGPGKRELAKFLARSASQAGIEGGISNALGTYPTAWAEGRNPSSVEVGQNALMGYGLGGLVGGGMGLGTKFFGKPTGGDSLTGATVEPGPGMGGGGGGPIDPFGHSQTPFWNPVEPKPPFGPSRPDVNGATRSSSTPGFAPPVKDELNVSTNLPVAPPHPHAAQGTRTGTGWEPAPVDLPVSPGYPVEAPEALPPHPHAGQAVRSGTSWEPAPMPELPARPARPGSELTQTGTNWDFSGSGTDRFNVPLDLPVTPPRSIDASGPNGASTTLEFGKQPGGEQLILPNMPEQLPPIPDIEPPPNARFPQPELNFDVDVNDLPVTAPGGRIHHSDTDPIQPDILKTPITWKNPKQPPLKGRNLTPLEDEIRMPNGDVVDFDSGEVINDTPPEFIPAPMKATAAEKFDFGADWTEAIDTANEYGIDWRKYDDIEKLKADLTKEEVRRVKDLDEELGDTLDDDLGDETPDAIDVMRPPFKFADQSDDISAITKARADDPEEIAKYRAYLRQMNERMNSFNENIADKANRVDLEAGDHQILTPEEQERYLKYTEKVNAYDEFFSGVKPDTAPTSGDKPPRSIAVKPPKKLEVDRPIQDIAAEIAAPRENDPPEIAAARAELRRLNKLSEPFVGIADKDAGGSSILSPEEQAARSKVINEIVDYEEDFRGVELQDKLPAKQTDDMIKAQMESLSGGDPLKEVGDVVDKLKVEPPKSERLKSVEPDTDKPRYDHLEQRRTLIFDETDPVKAAENLQNLKDDLEYVRMEGDKGQIKAYEDLVKKAEAHTNELSGVLRPGEYEHPTAVNLVEKVVALDAADAKDTAYKAILPGKKGKLGEGETWRDKVVRAINRFESIVRKIYNTSETGAVGFGGIPGGRGTPKVDPPSSIGFRSNTWGGSGGGGKKTSSSGGAGGKKPGFFKGKKEKYIDPVTQIARNIHGLRTTGDLAPVFRQGKNYYGRDFWRQAFIQQFKSYSSEESHQKFMAKLNKHRLMVPEAKYGKNKDGKNRSWAEMAGIYVGAHKQEEAVAGIDFAEKYIRIPGKGGKDLINPARASARTYELLDHIRVGASEDVYDNFKKQYESMKRLGATKAELDKINPDIEAVAKRIGDSVNQASGRSRLKIKTRYAPDWKIIPERWRGEQMTPDYLDMEDKADAINLFMFAGRYMKSNMDQLGEMVTMLPKYMISKDPATKLLAVEKMKQALSYAGSIVTIATLNKAMGAAMQTDPLETDFGKARHGKRITVDATGGQGKFPVMLDRALSGTKKTAKGKLVDIAGEDADYGQGDVVKLFTDFGLNQLASPAALAIAVMNRKERFGGDLKPFDIRPWENTIMKNTIMPMTWQNFAEILKEDPSYSHLILQDAIGASVNVESK